MPLPVPVRRLLIAALLMVCGCRRDTLRLEPAQQTAYLSKPAVVRVDAYAEANFDCPSSEISRVAEAIGSEGAARPGRTVRVATGAGGSGSGFLVRPDGVIVTSGHVVAGIRDPGRLDRELRRNGAIALLTAGFPVQLLRQLQRDNQLEPVVARLASAGTLSDIRVTSEVELSTGRRRPFTIMAFTPSLPDRGVDLALLKISAGGLPTLPLADADAVRVGTSVWAIGYPAVASSSDEVIGGWLSAATDLEPTFDPGTITAIRRNSGGVELLQTNAAIYPGNSGGPVVDASGNVVGISTFGHDSAEQIRFLVPAGAAKTLLRKAGLEPESGEFDARYRAAVASAVKGEWDRVRTESAAASALFPGSPDVIRLSNDANRALRAMPWWQRHAVLAGGTVCALIALMVLTAKVLPKRAQRPAGPVSDIRILPASRVPGSRERAPRMAAGSRELLGRFTILNGDRAGEKLGLGGSGIRIGREPEFCEIVLENPKVSRLHAEVVEVDGKVLLIDRHSSNGTYVNDERIDRHILQDGDIIYFGGRNAVAVAFHA